MSALARAEDPERNESFTPEPERAGGRRALRDARIGEALEDVTEKRVTLFAHESSLEEAKRESRRRW
jgi:hypothetical protein